VKLTNNDLARLSTLIDRYADWYLPR